MKVQRLKVCYTDLQNLASNLADETRHNAKGKLIQGIQTAMWHILDTGKFLNKVKDAALFARWQSTLYKVKVQLTRKSLVIKCSDALGSPENLCRDYKRPSERHVSYQCDITKLFKNAQSSERPLLQEGNGLDSSGTQEFRYEHWFVLMKYHKLRFSHKG